MTSRGLAAGTVISGKYRLIGHLGGGGMGDVYKAEHELAGRVVAIKILRAELAGNADVTRRFFQEAQAANRIRHPNIVDVIDADFSPQGPYVVMECLEGASLAYALSKLGKLDLATSLAVILPTLAALGAAHEHGIVHRDLKPENVFIASGWTTDKSEVRVKLLDFGIAKVLSGASSHQTNTGVVFGTPDYLSPEQASGDPAIDGRSDLFAVGTVLFELLTGRRAWESPNPVATAYKIVHAPAPRLAEIGVHVSPLVQHVLDVALAKDKDTRFSSAAAFADALAPIAPDGPTRRDVLRMLYDAVVAHQPTQAAPPKPAHSLSFEPSLPMPLREPLPPSDGWAAPSPEGKEKKPAAPSPITPTLVSNDFVARATPASAPRSPSSPEIRERVVTVTTPSLPRAPAPRAAKPDTPARPTTPVRAPSQSKPWFVRPLPESAKRRCHVRGTLPRATLAWIERSHGKARRDAILSALEPSLAESYRAGAFNALVWYELEQLHELLEEATHSALLDDPTAWRALTRDNFSTDLAAIFRPARGVDPMSLLRRFPAGFARLVDFGNPRVEELSPRLARVRMSDFEGASTALRFVTLGMIDGIMSGTTGLMVRLIHGEASFSPELEIEVHWRETSR